MPAGWGCSSRSPCVYSRNMLTEQSTDVNGLLRPELKKQLDYALSHPEEISKLAAVQSQVRARARGWGLLGAPSSPARLPPRLAASRGGPPRRPRPARLRAQVGEVQKVMLQNIDKVLERGEKLDTIVDKSDNLVVRRSAHARPLRVSH